MPTRARLLPAAAPFDGESLLGFLTARAVPGIETVEDGTYRRVLSLTAGPAVVAVTPREDGLRIAREPWAADGADALCARLFDLGTDPAPVVSVLGADPTLGPLVRRRPGLRVPGALDGFELGVRAIVGQQISVPAARTVLGRLVARYGEPLAERAGALTHAFPSAEALAAADPGAMPFPRARAEALRALARAVAAGELRLDPGVEAAGARAAFEAIPGVGPWTASYVAMRALGDRDAFLPGDAGVRRALGLLGIDEAAAERWRPFRSYAVVHLWRSLTR